MPSAHLSILHRRRKAALSSPRRSRNQRISLCLSYPNCNANFQPMVYGVLTALRGPGGGFVPAKGAGDVSLYDVFMLYHGLTLSNECLLGHGACSDETACCVHRHWRPTKLLMESFLKAASFADLVEMREENRRKLLSS